MKLKEALLCIDCESLYSFSSHCPHCGSQVGFPLERALNRCMTTAGGRKVSPLRASARRVPPITVRAVHSVALIHQSA